GAGGRVVGGAVGQGIGVEVGQPAPHDHLPPRPDGGVLDPAADRRRGQHLPPVFRPGRAGGVATGRRGRRRAGGRGRGRVAVRPGAGVGGSGGAGRAAAGHGRGGAGRRRGGGRARS